MTRVPRCWSSGVRSTRQPANGIRSAGARACGAGRNLPRSGSTSARRTGRLHRPEPVYGDIYLDRHRPEQIVARYRTPLAILVCECRRQRLLQAFPGHAPGQHRQGVREVDHLVDAGPEEVVRGHGSGLRFSQFLLQALYFPGVPAPSKGLRIKWSCGSLGFCRTDLVESGDADAPLATHLCYRDTGLSLLQGFQDLTFRELRLLHGFSPRVGRSL